MFTSKQLNPARNKVESFDDYRRRRAHVSEGVTSPLRWKLLWDSAKAGTMNLGRNAAKRIKRARTFA